MTIQILDEAREDFIEGGRFYERQEEGPGQYFLDSLFSDIDSLQFTPVSTLLFLATAGFFPGGFHSQCTIAWRASLSSSMRYWIVDGIRLGFESG